MKKDRDKEIRRGQDEQDSMIEMYEQTQDGNLEIKLTAHSFRRDIRL